jgi:hypothetical protein
VCSYFSGRKKYRTSLDEWRGWKWNGGEYGGTHLITERRPPFFFKIKKRKRKKELLLRFCHPGAAFVLVQPSASRSSPTIVSFSVLP